MQLLFFLSAVFASLVVVARGGVPVEEKLFSEVEGSTLQSVVVFYTPGEDESERAIETLEAISEAFHDTSFVFYKVSSSNDLNKKDFEEANFVNMPMIFTNSVEGGIEPFRSTFTVSNVLSHLEFLRSSIESDHVETFVNEEDLLQRQRPIFLKFYEEWCGHCKRLKKHFQALSNDVFDSFDFVEIECSRDSETQDYCKKQDVNGYPTLKFFENGFSDPETYEGGRTYDDMLDFLRKHKRVESTQPSVIPDDAEKEETSSNNDPEVDVPSSAPGSAALADLEARMQRIEAKMDKILRAFGAISADE